MVNQQQLRVMLMKGERLMYQAQYVSVTLDNTIQRLKQHVPIFEG
jgi:hypothetical protein